MCSLAHEPFHLFSSQATGQVSRTPAQPSRPTGYAKGAGGVPGRPSSPLPLWVIPQEVRVASIQG